MKLKLKLKLKAKAKAKAKLQSLFVIYCLCGGELDFFNIFQVYTRTRGEYTRLHLGSLEKLTWMQEAMHGLYWYVSIAGHAQYRLQSPYTWSIRFTDRQNLLSFSPGTGTGHAASCLL